MTPEDVVDVLTKCAAYDQRTVGEADVMAWHEALSDLDAADALTAVARHYASSDARIMPVHVRRLAAELARDRHRIAREASELRAIEDYRAAAGPLTDRSAEIQAFVGQVRGTLPDGDSEALRPRAAHWDREHRAYQRQVGAEPNPHFDPSMRPVEWQAGPTPGPWWESESAREQHSQDLLGDAGRLEPRSGP